MFAVVGFASFDFADFKVFVDKVARDDVVSFAVKRHEGSIDVYRICLAVGNGKGDAGNFVFGGGLVVFSFEGFAFKFNIANIKSKGSVSGYFRKRFLGRFRWGFNRFFFCFSVCWGCSCLSAWGSYLGNGSLLVGSGRSGCFVEQIGYFSKKAEFYAGKSTSPKKDKDQKSNDDLFGFTRSYSDFYAHDLGGWSGRYLNFCFL